MKKFTILSIIIFLCVLGKTTQSQTVYASLTSGAWGSGTEWETFPNLAAALSGSTGSGTASSSTTNPGGTHFVLIRAGHTVTMGDVNRGCKGMVIQAGGKLWGSGNTTDRRLQIGAGGTGFTYPLVDTLQVDGTLGGVNDPMYIESGANCQNLKVFGSGSIDIKRIRTPGGNGPSAGGVMNFDVDENINLWQTANYALSIVYTTPNVTDNYTFTIFPGRTVAIKSADGVFHNSSNATTYGNYTYNIKGILDLTANTQATSNTSGNIIVPAPAASHVAITVDGGILKLGASFKADTSQSSPPSSGILNLNIINGGTVDASLTTNIKIGKTSDGAGGYRDLVFATDATSILKLPVGSSQVKFAIGLSTTTTPNSVYITNSGTSDIFSVAIKGTITNAPPNANVVNRQWTITEAVAGGTVGTIGLSWTTADQAAGFNPAAIVSILRWTGTAYEAHAATVTGTGTTNDPYVATASGFNAFSPFIVANFTALPIAYQGQSAFQKNNGIQVEWQSSFEINVDRYIIQKSNSGSDFRDAGMVLAQGNNQSSVNYVWFDANPFNGNNFYRIRAIDRDGSSKYSSVMKVSINSGKPNLVVYPNPVNGSLLNLQLTNMAKGTYTAILFNASGQKVFSNLINSEGGSSSQSLKLPASLKPGIYNLQLNNGSDVKINKEIAVE